MSASEYHDVLFLISFCNLVTLPCQIEGLFSVIQQILKATGAQFNHENE